jgi:hypothetical protein
MAELTIQYLHDPDGRQRLFRIALRSDEDATPREHEQDHRRLIQTLLPGIDLDTQLGDSVAIEREAPQQEPCLGCSGGDGGYEVIDIG